MKRRNMRPFIIASLVAGAQLTLVASVVRAEGLPSLKDSLPPSASTLDWSGPYFGASVGYGHNRSKNNYKDDSPASSSVLEHADGGLVSLVLGVDRQISDRVVVGAFVDLDLSAFDRGNHAEHNALTIDRSLSIGARAGYLVRPQTLVYASGGFTRAHFSNDGWWDILANGVGPNLPGKAALNFNGYFVGLGFETRLRENLFLGAELRYAQYGQLVTNSGVFQGTTYVDKEDPSLITGRVGITYKFGHQDHSGREGVADEYSNIKVVSYGGVDFAKDAKAFYSGSRFALNGDFTKDGVIFRAEGVYAKYHYPDANIPEGKVGATDRSLDVMIGYQHYFGSLGVIGYAGYEIRDVALNPDAPGSKLRGTKDGFKIATEIETEDGSPFYMSFDGSYSTAFNSYFAELRVGHDWKKFIIGPEGSLLSDAGDLSKRIGGFVKIPFQLRPNLSAVLTVDGGYQFASGNGGEANRHGGEGGYVGSMLKLSF